VDHDPAARPLAGWIHSTAENGSIQRRRQSDLVVGLANLGTLLIQRGRPGDLQEARGHLERAATLAGSMRIPFPDRLHRWLASREGHS
jgi:hypothetical protein